MEGRGEKKAIGTRIVGFESSGSLLGLLDTWILVHFASAPTYKLAHRIVHARIYRISLKSYL